MTAFRLELEILINRHSMESGSNTPDFILAAFLSDCLKALDASVTDRDKWYHEGMVHVPGFGLAESREEGKE